MPIYGRVRKIVMSCLSFFQTIFVLTIISVIIFLIVKYALKQNTQVAFPAACLAFTLSAVILYQRECPFLCWLCGLIR